MHIQPSKEDMIHLTKLNPFERFPDGRPQVPDDYLERMKFVTEEAWAVLMQHGYKNQFRRRLQCKTHPRHPTCRSRIDRVLPSAPT